MKTLGILTIVVLITVLHARVIVAQSVTVTIDQIVADEQISGYVHSLNPADYRKYKVIVFVHTDQWYIHPYAGQDEGLSWTTIKANGTWQIQTVQRQFRADKVAALLVSRNYPEPNKVESLKRVPHKAIVIKELRNTPDYGKL